MPVVWISCSGNPLSVCFIQINYVKATNRATLFELPGFVFGSDAANFFSGLKRQFPLSLGSERPCLQIRLCCANAPAKHKKRIK